jgi:NAD(P)-dependent dehydrogenase (short-subunit alcohol dehydrogenase family)
MVQSPRDAPMLPPPGANSDALGDFLELRPFGVRVILVEPGAFATKFVANIRQARTTTPASPYHEGLQQLLARLRQVTGNPAMDPQRVADAVYEAAVSGKPVFRWLVGIYPAAGGQFTDRLGAAYQSGQVVSLAQAVTRLLDQGD